MKKLFTIIFCLLTYVVLSQTEPRSRVIEDLIDLDGNPIGTRTYHKDADLDTYGDKNITRELVSPQPGWVLNRLDCDDSNPSITIARIWYKDQDNDNYGDPSITISSCTQPSGYVSNRLDNCPTVFGTNSGCPASSGGTNTSSATYGNHNYIYEETFKVETTETTHSNVANSNKSRSISYFDGLGRKTQTRAIGQSPLGKDIVLHHEYDNLGRQAKEYLPYTSTQNNGLYETGGQAKTIAYYNVAKYQNTSNPYSEKTFDGSPLNRVLETGAPGLPWKVNTTSDYDHTNKIGYATNTATDNTHKVRWYKVSLTSSYTPTLTNPSPYYYPLRSLYKTIVKNENWTPTSGKLHTTEEFKNKFGQTVLKRTYAKIGSTITPHDTYYVYDVYNNLTFIIPPKVNTADGVNSSELNELCFQNKYDKYNRVIEQKVPGKGWEYIIYDKLNRPILTQDAVQRAKSTKEWLFTKYDAFGRVAYTGLYRNNSSRASLQASADARTTKFEKRGTTSIYKYTNSAFPTVTTNDVYVVNYYDDYNFDRAGLSIPSTVYGVATTQNVKSLPTGSKERILNANNAVTSHWITTITGYDDKARVVYTASKNTFLNTTDVSQSKLDFVGKTTETTSNHTSNTTLSIKDKFTYDHADRLITHKQQINTQPEELIVKNKYDELGVLENKKVGNTESRALQTVDFKYNVRGWLTDINNVNNIGTDLFTFKVNYNTKDIPTTTGYSSLFDGKITETIWRTKNDSKKRGYQYKYDALSRLLGANYRENDNLTSGSGKLETSYGYDKNGNIKSLTRKNYNAQTIDNLTYSYASYSNKLNSVNDAGTSEGKQSSSIYTYENNNKNLIKDSGKGITNIEYNHLDLPVKVHFGSSRRIEYIYTASGIKLQKKVINGATTTTNYAGGFIYENNVLKHFAQPEGYVEKEGSSFKYIYQYADHQGNIRLNYTNIGSRTSPNLQIREENNYYPFGLKHKGYNIGIIGSQNNYKYNNKELQDEVINGKRLEWYDLGGRNYDPTIGRFFNIDPLASQASQVDKSPYAFTWNNPINLVDPDGLSPDTEMEDDRVTLYGKDGRAVVSSYGSVDKKNKKEDSIINEAKRFGKYIYYTYELLDDKKNLHKITLRGNTWINGGKQRRQLLEIIIDANGGKPIILSSTLSGGVYEKKDSAPNKNGIVFQKWVKTQSFKEMKNFDSPLSNYASDPLINTLRGNSEYNPFNGSVKGTTVLNGVNTAAAAYSAVTTQNVFFSLMGKTWGKRYIAASAGVAIGNLYRNNADHTGRKIEFKLY